MDDPRRLALLETAVRQATDAVVITNADLDPPGPLIVFVNPAFCAMTGYRADELLGRSPRLLQGPATDRAELGRVRHALERGQAYQGEVLNYRKDGRPYHMRWHMDPVCAADGALTHWVAIQRDVSAEHAAAAERASAYAAAHAALRLRDDLLTVVSHELRTPLTALVGYTEMLRGAAAGERPAHELARFGALVAQQAQRLTALISELLDLERLEAGALPLAQQAVDLAALTTAVTAAFQARLPATHCLRVAVPSVALQVIGDELRLRHVIEELLGNALAFSPDGGPINVTLARLDDTIELAVQDTGIGIPQSDVRRLGERFYRASNVDILQLPGFGVGLYAVREIARRHGGHVKVDSAEGQGTLVRLVLPAH